MVNTSNSLVSKLCLVVQLPLPIALMTIRSKQRDSASRKQRAEIAELRGRYDLLAHREHKVLELVVTGLL